VSDRSQPGLAIDCAEVVEAHLALCEGCDTYLTQMRSTIDVLGHVPVESLTEQARTELLTAFHDVHVRREPTA
jgi:hypothetical protein